MRKMKDLDLITTEDKYIILKDIDYMKRKIEYTDDLEELYII